MNHQCAIFLIAFFWGIPLRAQDQSLALAGPNPLGNDLFSQSLYGAANTKNEAYAGMQTLPYYAFATSYQFMISRQVENRQVKLGALVSGLQLGAYRGQEIGVFLRKQFSPKVAVWFMPQLKRETIRAYGSQFRFGAECGVSTQFKSWEMAMFLRSGYLSANRNIEGVFSWRYALSKYYFLSFFIQNAQRRPMSYGLQLAYQVDDQKRILVGIGANQHFAFSYVCKKNALHYSFGLHYAPVQGFYPDNGLHYAF